jgi:predicted RNA-binding protein with PIN domain
MQFVIDGNNLMYAYAEVAGPAIGRQHLCEVVARWACRSPAAVVIVFDGPPPPSGVRRQMQYDALEILFGEGRTADEVIEDLVERAASPSNVCIVTSDRALAAAGRHRRCRWIRSQDFVRMLAAPPAPPPAKPAGRSEKPETQAPGEVDAWLRQFGLPTDDSDDPSDLMKWW